MESFIYFCNEKEVERFAHAVQEDSLCAMLAPFL